VRAASAARDVRAEHAARAVPAAAQRVRLSVKDGVKDLKELFVMKSML
jgi:hypothetical protein